MNKEKMDGLYAPFKVRTRVGYGRKEYTYIATEDVLDRMNKVFDGVWSTKILNTSIIEDQVLAHVCVEIIDDGIALIQEGFASHPIMRYNGGQNDGKIVDLGNSYRAAVSKAIKAACKRWGLGLLFDDEDSSESDRNYQTHDGPPINTQQNSNRSSGYNNPPINIPPSRPAQQQSPVIPSIPSDLLGGIPDITPARDGEGIRQEKVSDLPTNNSGPMIPDVTSLDSATKITPVQLVALRNILKNNQNMTFKELAVKVLERQDNIPDKEEDLFYPDAVRLIQFGNKILLNR